MLHEVQALHAELLSLIDDVDAEAARPAPDVPRLTTMRWKLSRATSRRTKLMEERVYPWLLGHLPPAKAAQVRSLRETNLAIAAATSRHVGKWTVDAVVGEWDEYRRESNAMRAKLRERIGAEIDLLYPLLATAPAA